MARPRPVVAIDGPAGAGKSTVAQRLAARLGFTLVDTGALYRAVALACRREGMGWDDADAVASLAERLASERRLRLFIAGEARSKVLLDGVDVGDAIRTRELSLGASQVSAIPRVRGALFAIQREAGEQGAVVLEGRDIGTVVFPDAELKVFLTARPEVRAERRRAELETRGEPADLASILAEVIRRDEQDTTRAIAPLRRAEDAVVVDASDLSADHVVDQIEALVRARWPG